MPTNSSPDGRPDQTLHDRQQFVTSRSAGDVESASATADAARLDMLRAIDGELADLNGLIGTHHAAGADSAQAAVLQETASSLAALRGQIEAARSPAQLASLRLVVAGAVQGAGSAMASAASGSLAHQQLAARTYDTRMTAVEQGMADISRRDDLLFASADSRAEQLGLDVGFFRGQRSLLEAEVDAARKRGDRFGAIVPEGLLAHNTANMWDDIADRTGLPEDRKKAEAGRKIAEEADERVREAAQVEATRAAAGHRFTTDAERDRWIAGDAGKRFQQYQDRVEALHQSGSRMQEQQATSALHHSAFAEGLNTVPPTDQPIHAEGGLVASLPASVREAAKNAARPIAQETTAVEVDDDHKAAPATPAKVAAVKSSPHGSVTL